MDFSYRQLVLCPSDETWVPASRGHLEDSLRSLGMLGAMYTDEAGTKDRYLIGDAFLQLFSFMGCAPSIEFAPAVGQAVDWQGFVFIHISPDLPEPRWLVDDHNAKPACPHCQRRNRNWLQYYQSDSGALACPQCQYTESACRWRWYDAGACARQFISIANVYPKESIPTDTLLTQLQQSTSVPWCYFYLHGPLIAK